MKFILAAFADEALFEKTLQSCAAVKRVRKRRERQNRSKRCASAGRLDGKYAYAFTDAACYGKLFVYPADGTGIAVFHSPCAQGTLFGAESYRQYPLHHRSARFSEHGVTKRSQTFPKYGPFFTEQMHIFYFSAYPAKRIGGSVKV